MTLEDIMTCDDTQWYDDTKWDITTYDDTYKHMTTHKDVMTHKHNIQMSQMTRDIQWHRWHSSLTPLTRMTRPSGSYSLTPPSSGNGSATGLGSSLILPMSGCDLLMSSSAFTPSMRKPNLTYRTLRCLIPRGGIRHCISVDVTTVQTCNTCTHLTLWIYNVNVVLLWRCFLLFLLKNLRKHILDVLTTRNTTWFLVTYPVIAC